MLLPGKHSVDQSADHAAAASAAQRLASNTAGSMAALNYLTEMLSCTVSSAGILLPAGQ